MSSVRARRAPLDPAHRSRSGAGRRRDRRDVLVGDGLRCVPGTSSSSACRRIRSNGRSCSRWPWSRISGRVKRAVSGKAGVARAAASGRSWRVAGHPRRHSGVRPGVEVRCRLSRSGDGNRVTSGCGTSGLRVCCAEDICGDVCHCARRVWWRVGMDGGRRRIARRGTCRVHADVDGDG